MATEPAKAKTSKNSILNRAAFAWAYVTGCLVVLFGTSLYWAILGSRLHLGNSDQLANAYLFERSSVFHGAMWPSQHTFLLKWPIFLLIKLADFRDSAFTIATVACVLLTVAALAWVIYRIERRPLVFGTLCLALAGVLLLVPLVPYAGAILPVSMAMLTTRNVEYIFLLAALSLLARAPRIRSRTFLLATFLLTIVIASDRLFLTLSLGGAILALITYALVRSWNFVSLGVHWLAGSVIAGFSATAVLWLVNATRLTHISNAASSSPYTLVHNAHDVTLGMFYAASGIATNLGANPAYSAVTIRSIPSEIWKHGFNWGGPGYLINLVVAVCLVLIMIRLLFASMFHGHYRGITYNTPFQLAILLIWSSLAGILAFAFTDHSYVVDSRYLAIVLFAAFVSAAVYLSHKQWRPEWFIRAGLVLLVGVLFGCAAQLHDYRKEQAALASLNKRDGLIADVLSQHQVSTLLGDYWRVLPTKQQSGGKLAVTPLANCTQNRNVLSSEAWQPDITNHSFAYILPFDHSLTDFPSCSLDTVISTYGRPNASTVVEGTPDKPKELLLFYDHGTSSSAPKITPASNAPSTVLPIGLDELPNTSCAGPTIMNVVAHQDDDLLFMNPDLLHSIQADRCVRTIYVTAGDAGVAANFHWLSRQKGSEAAYSKMLGTDTVWIHRIVKLDNNQFITVSNPRGNPKVSLIYMNLPDGNLGGDGFSASHFQSLAFLMNHKITAINSVDGQSKYTSSQLVGALADLMGIYNPAEIRTQSSKESSAYPDHSDHMTVGRLTKQASQLFEAEHFESKVRIPFTYYIGYPVRDLPANVSPADLIQKQSIFLAYAAYDSGVCNSAAACEQTPTYGAYLTHQYTNSN